MNKPNLSKIAKDAKTVLARYSPEILTGIGIAGMITSTVLAVKATPKALRHLEDAEYDKGEPLTAVEKAKACWKDYIPAAVTGVTATACVVGASSINYKRNAALAAAYTLSETAFSEYKEKVIETIGEKKEQVVKDKVAEEKIKNDPVSQTKEVIITEKGNTLCYDSLSGRYFKSDRDFIERAINELNRRMFSEHYISLNELYDEIGLKRIDLGDRLGWNLERGNIDPDFGYAGADDGTPCLVLAFRVEPRYDYEKLM